MEQKGQSAVEFLSVYSFAIIIMTIAVVLVLILSSSSTSILPQECSFFGGFSCSDVVYATWNGIGSQLFLIATFTQPGEVNVSSFNVIISSTMSINGICTPNIVSEGETVYCTAKLNFAPRIGNTYTGSFAISANYCAGSSLSLYSYSCPANGNYIYTGTLQLQAEVQKLSGGPYYYVPFSVNNINTTNATQGGLQIMVTFKPNTFSSYESPNLGNIRFYDSAKELYSWCETNCASSSTSNVIFWVVMDRSIAPSGSASLSMYFLPNSIGYDSLYAGESPLQSNTYAQYDNGQNVFNFYSNFAGSTLNSTSWSSCSSSFCKVSNGVTVTPPAGGPFITNLNSESSFGAGVVDFYGVVPSSTGCGTYCLAGIGLANSQNINYSTAMVYVYGSSYGLQTSNNRSNTVRVAGLSLGSNTVYSVMLPSASPSSVSALANYGNSITIGIVNDLPTLPQSIAFIDELNSGLSIGPIYYVRVRGYPPGGVLPAVTPGNAMQVP